VICGRVPWGTGGPPPTPGGGIDVPSPDSAGRLRWVSVEWKPLEGQWGGVGMGGQSQPYVAKMAGLPGTVGKLITPDTPKQGGSPRAYVARAMP